MSSVHLSLLHIQCEPMGFWYAESFILESIVGSTSTTHRLSSVMRHLSFHKTIV